jgi:hypothetical protein
MLAGSYSDLIALRPFMSERSIIRAINHRAARDVVAAAPHRQLESGGSSETDRIDDVGNAAAAGDHRGTAVDRPVVHPPPLFVRGI